MTVVTDGAEVCTRINEQIKEKFGIEVPIRINEEMTKAYGIETRNLASEAYDAITHPDGPFFNAEDLRYLIGLAGRTNGPGLLMTAWAESAIIGDVLTELVGEVWSGAELPDVALADDPDESHEDWRMLFDAAGFTVNGRPVERPSAPVELWRGSVPERCADWSWTTDRAVAEKYASGKWYHRPTGCLYRVVAPPEALLCFNSERGESEYVVDTAGLDIVKVDPAQ